MKIILAAINAKFVHSALAPRALKAFAGDENIIIKEYTINDPINSIAMDLFRERADVIGFSFYIWNLRQTLSVIEILKKTSPDIRIIAGGPEAVKNKYIDSLILGEGEREFKKALYNVDEEFSLDKSPFVYADGLPENKIIYYESSRGCPFNCQYCLSANQPLEFLDIERVYKELDFFILNRARQIKFVDRTFNADAERAFNIWKYIIEKNGETNFHFEIAADLLTQKQLNLLKTAKRGLFQFEVGVQTTNETALKIIKRKTNLKKLFDNLKELKNIKLHLDLIAGLPGESFESFKKSFNDVYAVAPDEIQLGFLKILKNTGLKGDSTRLGIVYISEPPYEVLFTNEISYEELLKLKSAEKVLKVYYNSGVFSRSLSRVLRDYDSPFDFYLEFGEYWVANNLYSIRHKKINLYIEFFKFAGEPKDLKDLLKQDFCESENIKSVPDFFKGRTL
jgi:anaerobic magnesium-protoporphyrin IX monomethyl ester cyclase